MLALTKIKVLKLPLMVRPVWAVLGLTGMTSTTVAPLIVMQMMTVTRLDLTSQRLPQRSDLSQPEDVSAYPLVTCLLI